MSELARKLTYYRMMEEIGRGGAGVVYRAEHEHTKHQVAIKMLHQNLTDDTQQVERFYREARLHEQMRHPNIMHFIGMYESGDTLAIVMELLQGCSLKAYLEHHGALSNGELRTVLESVIQGLHVAHTQGVIHRDIKPSNLFLCDNGRIKIMDFGLAKGNSDADDITKTALNPVGSYYFMAPEQIIGQKVDARTDFYALGISLFQLATNSLPFEATVGGAFEIMEKQMRHEPPDIQALNPNIDAAMVRIILKLLEKQPKNRFQNCQAVAESLASLPPKEALSRSGKQSIQKFSDLHHGGHQVSQEVAQIFQPDAPEDEPEQITEHTLLWAFQCTSKDAPKIPPLDLNTPLPLSAETLKRLKDGISTIAPLPDTWQKVQRILEQPDAAVYDLGKCVEQDAVLTAHVLKVCNSAAYRTPGSKEITQVTLALARLGMDVAQDIILQAMMPKIPTSANPHEVQALQFHNHCLATFVRILLDYNHITERYTMSLIAMLHDIGKMIILNMESKPTLEALKTRIQQGEPSLQVEWDVLGYTHIDAGMMLALHWRLPRSMHRMIYFHHHPCWHASDEWPKNMRSILMLLHTAHLLLDSMDMPEKYPSIWHASQRMHTAKSKALLINPLKLPLDDEQFYQHLRDEATHIHKLYPTLLKQTNV